MMALLVTSFSLLFIYRTIKINKVCSCSSTFCEFSSENSSISEYSLESNGSKQTLTKCKVSLCELSTDQDNCHSPQIFRHSLLLMLMCCSMIAGLTLPLWRLLTQQLETDIPSLIAPHAHVLLYDCRPHTALVALAYSTAANRYRGLQGDAGTQHGLVHWAGLVGVLYFHSGL